VSAEPLLPHLAALRARIAGADHILTALDYDGTLAPIAETPEEAAVPPETAAVVRELASGSHATVAIVSGRSVADLRLRMAEPNLILAGNHGLEIEGPGISFVHPGAWELRDQVDFACWDLEAALESLPGVRMERKGLTATVHYRQMPKDLAGWIDATVLAVTRPYRSRLIVKRALKAWEIRPRVQWNKGSAIRFLLRWMRAPRPLLICAGDDAADEDMYGVMGDAISIRIGTCVSTLARYSAGGPEELGRFLAVLREDCAKASVIAAPGRG